MKLTKRQVSGIAVVDVEGKLIGGSEYSTAFHECFRSLLDNGHRQIVINLENTPWANSQGLGMLIAASASVKNAGGELVLTHVGDRVHSILVVTKLCVVFTSFETVDSAIEHFHEKPTAMSA